MSVVDPHGRVPLIERGPAAAEARAGLILVHGRGATATGMLTIADEVAGNRVAVRAPQAAGNTWYPLSFLSPTTSNEPGLSSAIRRIGGIIDELVDAGLSAERIVLLGFSQGACLAAEYLLRNPRRYGGALLLTGGFQGPPGTVPAVVGDFAGTPVFLGSSDPDPHVPWDRVEATAQLLASHGAEVTTRRYPGMPHTIHREELDAAAAMMTRASGQG